MNFSGEDGCKNFACFFGPNGCGKTTILDAIQILFSRYEGRSEKYLKILLGKSVRHVDGEQTGVYGDGDFLITAEVESSIGNYEVRLNKGGFLQDHPEEIKSILYRLCFYARFDQELRNFQLARDKWPLFKDLFEAVTGFEIEEKQDLFHASDDPVQAKLFKEYILNFSIQKPNEIISQSECSAGERKIIKSFSTLLNKEYIPAVILVDNVAMHVESGRHLNLIESMKRCFPESQIFATTHSYQISRNFGDRAQLYDLRLIKVPPVVKGQPWRLYFSDEIKDCLSKLQSMTIHHDIVQMEIGKGEDLLDRCLNCENSRDLVEEVEMFMKRVAHLFVKDISSYYSK